MVSSETFRDVLGRFATGVTVVTFDADGIDHGLTVNSFASLSLDPPLVLWNCADDTYSYDLLEEADNYAVNILTAEQEWLSNRFAGEHHDMDDPFEDVPLFRAETGAPIFEETLAYLDCSIEQRYPGGDHEIYVGRIEDLDVLAGEADPLTFYRGSYGTIAESG